MLGKTSTSCQDSISSWCNDVYIYPIAGLIVSSPYRLEGDAHQLHFSRRGAAEVCWCCSIILPPPRKKMNHLYGIHGPWWKPLPNSPDHRRSSQIIADHPGVGMPALAATTEATACSIRAIQTCCLQKCLQYPLVIQSGNGYPVFWPHFTFIFYFPTKNDVLHCRVWYLRVASELPLFFLFFLRMQHRQYVAIFMGQEPMVHDGPSVFGASYILGHKPASTLKNPGQLSNSQNWCEEMQSGDPTGGSNQAHPPEQSMPFWNIVVSATSGWDMGAQNHRTWVSLTYFEWGNGWIFWGHPFWEHSILPAMIMHWWRWSDLEKQTANDVVLIGGSD